MRQNFPCAIIFYCQRTQKVSLQDIPMYCNDPKLSDRHVCANSVDPDQTVPSKMILFQF